MERDDQQIKGWRKYKHAFKYGTATKREIAETDDRQTPCTLNREPIGNGCYQAVSDFDTLDQQ